MWRGLRRIRSDQGAAAVSRCPDAADHGLYFRGASCRKPCLISPPPEFGFGVWKASLWELKASPIIPRSGNALFLAARRR
jgi:hypothetical protein